MEKIQICYPVNYRYSLFVENGQYYLLDMRPARIIGYPCFPLNWMLYHQVYPITTEEYVKIQEKHHKANKWAIPTSLVCGFSVYLNSWARVNKIDIFKPFYTNFSLATNIILLVVGLIVTYPLLQWVYRSQKRKIQTLLNRELDKPLYYKLSPTRPVKAFFKFFSIWFPSLLMLIAFAVAFLYLNNIIPLLGTIMMTFGLLGSGLGAFYQKKYSEHKIMDILPNSEQP